jgi:hypothetical protein
MVERAFKRRSLVPSSSVDVGTNCTVVGRKANSRPVQGQMVAASVARWNRLVKSTRPQIVLDRNSSAS